MLSPFFGFGGLLDRFDSVGPQVHVRETPNAAVLEIEVPRYKPDEIKVTSNPETGGVTIVAQRATQHTNDDDLLLFAASPLTRFARTFTFSPSYYDVSKFQTALEFGVLTVTVPKLDRKTIESRKQEPAPQAVTVFGGDATAKDVVAKTTPEEFEALAKTRWPPVIKREENATALTYKCELPPTVTKDHITLQLHGRHLDLAVNYNRHTKTKHSEESHSVTYSTTLTVPSGTQPSDIHTSYENGLLTVSLDKREQKQAIPVDSKPKA